MAHPSIRHQSVVGSATLISSAARPLPRVRLGFVFNVTDRDDFDELRLFMNDGATNPLGYETVDGRPTSLLVTGGSTTPGVNADTWVWFRVQYDVTDLTAGGNCRWRLSNGKAAGYPYRFAPL